MKIILVPGLWLDARSWDAVAPALRDAGHDVSALTMPGVGEAASGIGMADWVGAVVNEIDAAVEPVMLVGHSGGGNVVWGAADQRPDRVRRVVFVDTVPPHPGGAISDFPAVDGVVPFPGWDFFPEEDVHDLDPDTRARALKLCSSIPAAVPRDAIALDNDARYQVPVTLLMGGMTQEEFEAVITQWGPYAEEFLAIRDRTVMKIGSAHWPQFSVPERLSTLLLESAR